MTDNKCPLSELSPKGIGNLERLIRQMTDNKCPPSESSPKGIGDLEKLNGNLEVWKKVIDVQQHFNTIEMQIRNFAVTILAGIIAAAGLALRDPKTIIIFNKPISSASAILVAGVIVLFSFYFMDRFWYHRLLQGAVIRGEKLETELEKVLPEIALSKTIRKESPVFRIRSKHKIDIFYGIIILFLLITAVGVNHLGDPASEDKNFNGYFNISLAYGTQNKTNYNAIQGSGSLEIRSNKSKSDLETILNNFQ